MKRIFAIALMICMLASMLCLTVFTADPTSGVVLQISTKQRNGSTTAVNEYDKIGSLTNKITTEFDNIFKKESGDIIDKSYIELGIALAGLCATIVSVILITTSDKRKEASKLKKENKKRKK